jgi:hypothetical protein
VTPRDELVELLAAELAEARETIGVLTERLSWFRAAVNDRDAARIIEEKPQICPKRRSVLSRPLPADRREAGANLRLVP